MIGGDGMIEETTDYESWADEYRQTADATKEKIKKLEEKRKHCRDPSEQRVYSGRLLILYEIYGESVDNYKKLLSKAKKLNRG